jgi:hypothetical protein
MERHSPARHDVAASVIDGEAIIMNLTNGAYYSMDGVGATVWQWIEEEQPLSVITERLATAYPIPTTIASDLAGLFAQLRDEGIVNAGTTASAVEATTWTLPATYAPPSLKKYTEMADLLALDPPMPTIAQPPSAAR